jgi:hypothetical protein
MRTAKTVHERELQSLLATPDGRRQLQDLESRYHAVSGKLEAARTSIVTYILVHERESGQVSG